MGTQGGILTGIVAENIRDWEDTSVAPGIAHLVPGKIWIRLPDFGHIARPMSWGVWEDGSPAEENRPA